MILARDRLISWGRLEPMPLRPCVVLHDGSVLLLAASSDIVECDDEGLKVEMDFWGSIQIPLPSVRCIILQPPTNRSDRDRLMLGKKISNASDQVLTVRNDRIQGRMINFDSKICRLRFGERSLAIKRPQISAIFPAKSSAVSTSVTTTTFTPRVANSSAPSGGTADFLVGLRDGSYLFAKSLEFSDRQTAIELLCGVRLTCRRFVDRSGLVCLLRPLNGSIVYLSSLSPTSYRHIPFLSVAWPYALNQNLYGEQLMHRGIPQYHGIAMHSTSRLTFALPKNALRFESELAIDDNVGRTGSVRYRVFLSRNNEWVSAFESDTIRGQRAPTRCSVNVQHANSISLVVDFADRADEGDHANWLNARLILKGPKREQ